MDGKEESLYSIGIFAGYFFVQTLCAIFIFGLENLINPVMFVLKYAGALYIVWLAYQIAISNLIR